MAIESVASTSSASDIQMDYMNLLVTQLKNQNPLEPLDNKEMASQLAQFSQLQQLENMNDSFSKVLSSIKQEYSSSLIGKNVTYTINNNGEIQTQSGEVDQVNYGNDQVILNVGSSLVALEDVISVSE